MKRAVPALIIVIALGARISPQDQGRPFESILPESPFLLVRTVNLGDCLESVRLVINRLLSDGDRARVTEEIAIIERRTGINLLDENSLKKTGIDPARRAALAYYSGMQERGERIALLIPVLDAKSFHLGFPEILRKASGRPDADMYPVISSYRSRSVHQIGKDIFTSAVDGYFIVASEGGLLQNIIDTAEDGAGSLALDPAYRDYLQKKKEDSDVDIYMKREFLAETAKKFLELISGAPQEKTGPQNGDGGEKSGKEDSDWREPGRGNDPDRDGIEGWFSSVNYAAVGLSVRKGRLMVDAGVDFDRSVGRTADLLESIKGGVIGGALYNADANTLLVLGLDLGRFESFCAGDGVLCTYYSGIKKKIMRDYAIDISVDIVPSSAGIVCFFMGSDSYPTLNSSSVVYFPLRDSGAIAEKTASRLVSLGKKDDVWGEIVIKGSRGFWYVGPSGRKSNLVFDKRGVFMGNNTDLIGVCIGSGTLSSMVKGSPIGARIDGDTFLFGLIKKNSFLKTMLMMQSGKPGKGMNFFQKIGDIGVSGKRKDGYVSFLLDVDILHREK